MKKITLLVAFLGISVFSFAQCQWQIGLELIGGANHSPWVGGMDLAHANYHHSDYDGGAWRINFQRQITQHWYGQVGIGISRFGFQDGISKDYSFLHLDRRWAGVNTTVRQLEFPASLIYKFKENCNRARWFVGAGFALVLQGKDIDVNKNINDQTEEVLAANGNLNQHVTVDRYATVTAHLMAGREKRLCKGGLLNVGIYLNPAFRNVATSEVTYSLDGTDYNHTFRNKGAYGGLMVNYYFRKFYKNGAPQPEEILH